VFQTKKVKPAVKKILFPCFLIVLVEIESRAMNRGTKPINNNGVVKGIGGQANQSKNALKRARR
jgi:hypothetical protein